MNMIYMIYAYVLPDNGGFRGLENINLLFLYRPLRKKPNFAFFIFYSFFYVTDSSISYFLGHAALCCNLEDGAGRYNNSPVVRSYIPSKYAW